MVNEMFAVFFILFPFFTGSYEGCAAPVAGKVDSIFHLRTKHIRNGGLPVCYGDESVSHHSGHFSPSLLLHRPANRNANPCGMLLASVSKGIFVFPHIDYRFFLMDDVGSKSKTISPAVKS